jgi:Tol biopolymer transport system component
MRLGPGTRLGRYEITGLVGAGGMGEVYRARDERLQRPVAVKVLPESFAVDPGRVARLKAEAQAAGGINHPNILTVFDVGDYDGSPYLVTELLDGQTLRERLAQSRLSVAKAVEYASHIALGLAAAHERGIVHRDLKPQNIFLTVDDRIKILDFGLAKTVVPEGEPAGPTDTIAPSASRTEAGEVVGTASYMSPEQVRGGRLDARSDIFSLGTILSEMLTGRAPFKRPSAIETLSAILKDDPPAWPVHPVVPPALRRITATCLEKEPAQRFQSARDLAFALNSSALDSQRVPVTTWLTARARGTIAGLLLACAAAAIGAAGFSAARWYEPGPAVFQRLSFRRGNHGYARFAPDGKTVLYGAWWNGEDARIFSTRLDSAESSPLDLGNADILSISGTGEIAILLNPTNSPPAGRVGTLAVAKLAGGAPRSLLGDVQSADWSPDGKALAVIRRLGNQRQLEYPIGRALYTAPFIYSARFSPRGDRIAFVEASDFAHPAVAPLAPSERQICTVDLSGRRQVLATISGGTAPNTIVWSPHGNEIWYSDRTLRAVSLGGRSRLIASYPEPVWGHLQDISRDGQILIVLADFRSGFRTVSEGGARERDLSWFGNSTASEVSADGKQVLFTEAIYRGKPSVYLRPIDGSAAVRLGDGRAVSISPDGRWVLAWVASQGPPSELVLYPTGPGEARSRPIQDIEYLGGGSWLPDGRRLIVVGRMRGQEPRVFAMSVDGDEASRPLTPAGVTYIGPISPDGRSFAGFDRDRRIVLYPIDQGSPRQLPGPPETGELNVWTADGRELLVTETHAPHVRIFRRDVSSGVRRLWKEITPADPAGIYYMQLLRAPGGESYIYNYQQFLSNLYAVSGLR